MLKGHNSDIQICGRTYHIQTEDWGVNNPVLVTRVYCNGAVIKTLKTMHAEALLYSGEINPEEALRKALHRQHVRMVDEVVSENRV